MEIATEMTASVWTLLSTKMLGLDSVGVIGGRALAYPSMYEGKEKEGGREGRREGGNEGGKERDRESEKGH